ncbi:unnamed protein product, partial [Scytosiphon promiscuus]
QQQQQLSSSAPFTTASAPPFSGAPQSAALTAAEMNSLASVLLAEEDFPWMPSANPDPSLTGATSAGNNGGAWGSGVTSSSSSSTSPPGANGQDGGGKAGPQLHG